MKTQNEIAKRLGITQAHLSKIISGESNAGLETAKRFAFLFNTDPIIWIDPGSVELRKIAFKKYKL